MFQTQPSKAVQKYMLKVYNFAKNVVLMERVDKTDVVFTCCQEDIFI